MDPEFITVKINLRMFKTAGLPGGFLKEICPAENPFLQNTIEIITKDLHLILILAKQKYRRLELKKESQNPSRLPSKRVLIAIALVIVIGYLAFSIWVFDMYRQNRAKIPPAQENTLHLKGGIGEETVLGLWPSNPCPDTV